VLKKEDLGEVKAVANINGKSIRRHFDGVHGKVVQIRELVETLDQMFDSFHRVNKLGKSMLGLPKPASRQMDHLR
jgi:hypothetical protein